MLRLRRRTDTLVADSLTMEENETQEEDNARYADELCPECGNMTGSTDVCASCGAKRMTAAATPDKVRTVMHEFKTGKLRLRGKGGKPGAHVTDRKQAIAIALSEARRAMTAAAFTAEERRNMADKGIALADGSYPIPDVEYLRKAIHALGRASQHGDYDKVKRHIVKRARALKAVDELPSEWNITASSRPRLRQTLTAAFGTRAFDESKVRRVPKGSKGGGQFTVKENAAGRFEVVDQDTGKKVAETTTETDAQTVADEKNAATPAPASRVEGPFTYPSGWTGRYDPAEGRYIGLDDVYMPADFDPTREPGRSAVAMTEGQDMERARRIANLANAGGGLSEGPSLGDYEGKDIAQAMSADNLTPDGREVLARHLAFRKKIYPEQFGAQMVPLTPDEALNAPLGQEPTTRLEDAYHDPAISPEGQRRIQQELGNRNVRVMTRGREQAIADELARSGSYAVNAQVPEGVVLPDPGAEPYSSKMIPMGGYGTARVVRSESGANVLQWTNARQHELWKALPPEEQTRIMNDAIARQTPVSASLLSDEWFEDTPEAIVAAIPVHPPEEWFANPELEGPTPITVTSDGRIYGHAAVWGTCHLGNPRGAGVCVQPPRSQTDYGLFHLGEIETEGGGRVPVGQITLDTGHAPLGASARTAAAHYDDTGTVVADVTAGEDEHGIYFAGALRPDVTPERLRKLTASKISGDWRGGELVGMLAVNVPGFPVPRTKARLVASGDGTEEVLALVAAGIVGEREIDARELEIRVQVLAARAEGGIDALADLAGA